MAAATKNKDPAIFARKQFILHYQQSLKSAGWLVSVEESPYFASLEVRFTNTTLQETLRFASEEIVPRKDELRQLGFTDVMLLALEQHSGAKTTPKWANAGPFNEGIWTIKLDVVEAHTYPFTATATTKFMRSDAEAHITIANGNADAYCYTIGSSLNCSDRPSGGVYVTLPDADQTVGCCSPARVIDKLCGTNNLDKSLQCDHLEGDILDGSVKTFAYRRARIHEPCLGCKQSDVVWDAFCVPIFKDALDQQHERCYIAGPTKQDSTP
jgi:hypothetical protein